VRILICSSEAVPFAKTGGLADVAGALPKALSGLGHDVRLGVPKYASAYKDRIRGRNVATVQVPLGKVTLRVAIQESKRGGDFPAYLVVSDKHFRRDSLYGYPDDAERFIVFQRAIIELLRTGDWLPDVIHCNDWQTGLIPVYLRTVYAQDPRLGRVSVAYTVHNLAYQGEFAPGTMELAGLPAGLFNMHQLEFWGKMNFMKGGLVFAEVLNTVSPSYSREIQTPEFGAGLDGVLRGKKDVLFGILNGIDLDEWNPATDKYIRAHYDAGSRAKKPENKPSLQKAVNLPQRDVPVFGMVSRLAAQKGLDILIEALPQIFENEVQIVILGSGDPEYHQALKQAQKKWPGKLHAEVGVFSEPLARLIYAGSDFFLMPSHYEPCGLGQMNSMRYGTIPIARSTGGLADTVFEFDPVTGRGNGVVFSEYSASAFSDAVERALVVRSQPAAWDRLMANAMAEDCSWRRSAERYLELYQRALLLRAG